MPSPLAVTVPPADRDADVRNSPTNTSPVVATGAGGGGVILAFGKNHSPLVKNVGLAPEQKKLVEAAAFDKQTRELIFDGNDPGSRCQGAMLVAALMSFGCRVLGDGSYELSDDAALSRFARQRAELAAEHAAATQAAAQQQQHQLLQAGSLIASLQAELTATSAALQTAQLDNVALISTRSPAADKVREAVQAASKAEVALRQAEARATKAEAAVAPILDELEAYRAAPNDRELARAYHEMQKDMAEAQRTRRAAQLRVQELEKSATSASMSTGKELGKLRAQLAAQQRVEERAAGSPRQLQLEADAAKAAQAEAERQLGEVKEMMRRAQAAAEAAQAAAGAARLASPATVMEEDLGRGARGEQAARSEQEKRPTPVCVRPLHAKASGVYDPEIAELLRRLVSEGKIAKRNVQAVLALSFLIHTGEVPKEDNMINAPGRSSTARSRS